MKIQAESKEWVITEDGQLVEVAANKKHSKMDEDEVTDFLPNAYVFSAAKYMELDKRDFTEEIVDEKFPRYLEGKKPEVYKKTSFADKYMKADKETPAKVISNIRKAHPVITDEEQQYNPFIQRANEYNKSYRQPAIDIVMKVSEFIKPEMNEGVDVYPESEKNPQRFYYGGYTKRNPDYVPKANPGLLIPLLAGGIMAGGKAIQGAVSARMQKKEYDREYKKENQLLQGYLSRQKGFADAQLGSSAVGDLANFMPTARMQDADYGNLKSSLSERNELFQKRMNPEQLRNQSLSDAATFARLSSGMGRSGSQASNFASALGSANQISSQYNQARADRDMDTGDRMDQYTQMELDSERNNKFNYDSTKRQNQVAGIQGLSNTYTAHQSQLASLDPYTYEQQLKQRLLAQAQKNRALRDARFSEIMDSGMGAAGAAFSVMG